MTGTRTADSVAITGQSKHMPISTMAALPSGRLIVDTASDNWCAFSGRERA